MLLDLFHDFWRSFKLINYSISNLEEQLIDKIDFLRIEILIMFFKLITQKPIQLIRKILNFYATNPSIIEFCIKSRPAVNSNRNHHSLGKAFNDIVSDAFSLKQVVHVYHISADQLYSKVNPIAVIISISGFE